MKKSNLPVKLVLLFFSLVLIDSCAVNPVTGKKQFMLMSEEQEVQLGLSYDPQVIATFGEYKSENILNFVQTKATEMGKISHRPNIEYHVKILDSPVVNAFAVPGGYIYLTRGILAQLNNEAELIGVLGHEMGHITARHSVSQQSKQQLGQLLLVGGMIAAPKYAQYAEYAMQGMQLLFLKFSRDDEQQADALGVAYSSLIGYDAHKMADFFQVLNKMSMADGHSGVPTFLSTHPDPGDRYNSVNQAASAWQDSLKFASYKVNSDSYLRMIDGVTYGEDPRQGYVEGNTFYHPELKFKFAFPAGWDLENSPAQVNMAPQDDKSLVVFTLASGKTLDEAASNTIKQLELTLESSNLTTINSFPARVVQSKQVLEDPSTGAKQTNRVLSYFIQADNLFYVFHGITTDADYGTYSKTFASIMGSFSRLTDASKLNVKPLKIVVKKVQRTGTLNDAFTFYGVKQDKKADLALLNNLELTDRVQAGKLIKIIGQ
ncbi:MAG: M48 family metalloprotease [Bacteroidales bacterium]|nr:M48 family metalloprotease [Bacteroidales bacterium]